MLACSGIAAGGAGAKSPKPVITGISASPATVVPDGSTAITATVSGASECILSGSSAVTELPATLPCEGGSVDRTIQLPANANAKSQRYILTLKAKGPGGTAKAKISVEVLGHDAIAGQASEISVTGITTCAVLVDGRLGCWGSDILDELPIGSYVPPKHRSEIPLEASGVGDAVQVAMGQNHGCVLLSTARVECWGDNSQGQTGTGTPEENLKNVEVATEVSGLEGAVDIDAGHDFTCAGSSTGEVDCWGLNKDGELGDGSQETAFRPVQVEGLSDAVQVAAGGESACALRAGGQIECWGSDNRGALGDGSGVSNHIFRKPREVAGVNDATQVTMGDGHGCALLSSGHVDCWGSNESGELGDGSEGEGASSDVPVEVTGITSAVQVAAGGSATCALLSSGHVDCWGWNGWGQLGDGTRTKSDVPVEVSGIANAVQIAAGEIDGCAVLSGGEARCWGNNETGQLGNGSVTASDVPVDVIGF